MKYKILTAFVLALGLFACEKTDILSKLPNTILDNVNFANLKFVNAYTSNTPAGAPGVGVTRFFIFQDKTKLNGNAMAAVGSWPGTATYAALKPGSANYFFVLDRRVGNDYGTPAKGDTAFKSQLNIEAGKYYTAFLIGVSPTQEVILVQDKLDDTAPGKFRARFANLVPDPARPIEVYSRREKKKLVTGLAYKGVSEFMEINVPVGVGDTLDVFDATSPSKPLYSFNNFFGVSRRSYTFYAQGRKGFRTEALSSYTNR